MKVGRDEQMITIDPKKAANIRLEDKVQTLEAIRRLKLMGISKEEILSAFGRLFKEGEIAYIMGYLDGSPECSPAELSDAFKSFSAYPY